MNRSPWLSLCCLGLLAIAFSVSHEPDSAQAEFSPLPEAAAELLAPPYDLARKAADVRGLDLLVVNGPLSQADVNRAARDGLQLSAPWPGYDGERWCVYVRCADGELYPANKVQSVSYAGQCVQGQCTAGDQCPVDACVDGNCSPACSPSPASSTSACSSCSSASGRRGGRLFARLR